MVLEHSSSSVHLRVGSGVVCRACRARDRSDAAEKDRALKGGAPAGLLVKMSRTLHSLSKEAFEFSRGQTLKEETLMILRNTYMYKEKKHDASELYFPQVEH